MDKEGHQVFGDVNRLLEIANRAGERAKALSESAICLSEHFP